MEPHPGLNNLDYAVLGILLLSAILAMWRGFVREIFSLIAWTGAYFAAAKLGHLAEPFMHHHIKNQQGAVWAAAILVFLITLLILSMIGNLIADMVRGKALSSIDRSLGFLFGLFRGALVVCIVYLAAAAIWWPDYDKANKEASKDTMEPPDFVLQAKTHNYMAHGAGMLKVFIPNKDLAKVTHEYSEDSSATQKLLNQKTLDILSTPGLVNAKEAPNPAYDDKNRSGLDQLIDEKSKP